MMESCTCTGLLALGLGQGETLGAQDYTGLYDMLRQFKMHLRLQCLCSSDFLSTK